MRLLFLTNLYPPHGKGGYEEWCQEVATQLRQRGHEVIVLTSQHSGEAEQHVDPTWVRRELHLEMELASLRNGFQFFTARQQRVRENFETLRSYVRRFQPEAIMIWGMWNIVRSLPILAEKLLPGRVIYYMGDYWPTLPSQFEFYWKAPAQHWYTQLPKSILGVLAHAILAHEELPRPQFDQVIFPTIFMRNELVKRGVQPKESVVIYGAADTKPYLQANANMQKLQNDQTQTMNTADPSAVTLQTRSLVVQGKPEAFHEKITLLWAGRLRSDKGAHTAIKALAKIVHDYAITDVELLIAGTGEQDYRTFLEYLVNKERIQPYVNFLGHQSKDAMPALYQRADIFLFTSVWQEPFGRVLIEAMAAGVTVIGSTVGGATEILIDNENSLTYPPGDVERLATQLLRLIRAPALRQRLATAGTAAALERFDLLRMAQEIEAYLKSVVKRADAQKLVRSSNDIMQP
ncbi:MAG: glycosyltransferase family 4 protein [Caldilineaceae bacterium]